MVSQKHGVAVSHGLASHFGQLLRAWESVISDGNTAADVIDHFVQNCGNLPSGHRRR